MGVGLDSFFFFWGGAEVFFHGLKMELSFWNGLFVRGHGSFREVNDVSFLKRCLFFFVIFDD